MLITDDFEDRGAKLCKLNASELKSAFLLLILPLYENLVHLLQLCNSLYRPLVWIKLKWECITLRIVSQLKPAHLYCCTNQVYRKCVNNLCCSKASFRPYLLVLPASIPVILSWASIATTRLITLGKLFVGSFSVCILRINWQVDHLNAPFYLLVDILDLIEIWPWEHVL